MEDSVEDRPIEELLVVLDEDGAPVNEEILELVELNREEEVVLEVVVDVGVLLDKLDESVEEMLLTLDEVDKINEVEEAAKDELLELEDDDEDDIKEHVPCAWIVLVLSVSDPPRANTPPWIVDAVFVVTETAARIFPTKFDPTPIVALVPTCQKTLHA
jgi:hypothetical protein